ncbi:MAG: hypothetical protein ACT4OO_12170 [Nitrospiraceae bacterium]
MVDVGSLAKTETNPVGAGSPPRRDCPNKTTHLMKTSAAGAAAVLFCAAFLLFACSKSAQAPMPEAAHPSSDPEDHLAHRHSSETVESMAPHQAHLGPHFRWTSKRTPTLADQKRAEETLRVLRDALVPYQDYRRAIKDGFEPFLPNVELPHYHFTSKWNGFKGAFRFNPAQPTSLLYKKVDGSYVLEGAMYTAPKRANEEQLNERVPLSVAQWHAHVNICLPPKKETSQANWDKFGPKGSIVTEEDCDHVKGRFYPQLFGWMVHVYPFFDTHEKIWTH